MKRINWITADSHLSRLVVKSANQSVVCKTWLRYWESPSRIEKWSPRLTSTWALSTCVNVHISSWDLSQRISLPDLLQQLTSSSFVEVILQRVRVLLLAQGLPRGKGNSLLHPLTAYRRHSSQPRSEIHSSLITIPCWPKSSASQCFRRKLRSFSALTYTQLPPNLSTVSLP